MSKINLHLAQKLDVISNIIFRIGGFYQTLKDCREGLSKEEISSKDNYNFFKTIEFGL